MKVVVIDASWSCAECGRWIKPRTLGFNPHRPSTLVGWCSRDRLVIEPRPRPYRVRIEEDAA